MEHQTGSVCKYEKLGVPSVAVYESDHIRDQHKSLCVMNFVPEARGVFLEQGQTGADVLEDVVAALTKPLSEAEEYADLYEPPPEPRIGLEQATHDEVQAYYEGDLSRFVGIDPRAEMTDGLPVIPPTEEKVAEFLAYTVHDPHEIVGRMPPRGNSFDVEKVAVNGVMAGCKPEYMPVLLAMAEALCDPANSQGYHTTTAFGWMGVVSGPIADEIGMSYQRNIFNPGNPANASIGRAMNLMKLNLGGWVREVRMIANAGNPANYSCVVAEDVEGLEWPTLAEEHGLDEGENGFTIFHGMKYIDLMYSYFPNPPMYPGAFAKLRPELNGAPEQWIVDGFKSCNHPAEFGIFFDKDRANSYHDRGISKEDLRLKLWEMATITNEWGVRNIPWYHHGIGGLLARTAGYEDWKEAPMDAVFHLPPDPRDISFIVSSKFSYLMKLTHISTISIDKWGTGPKAAEFIEAKSAKQKQETGEKLVLSPVSDSQIVRAEPDTNFGDETRMLCDLGKSRALIKFDLSQIPSGSTINSATLRLGPHLVPKYGWYAGNITVGLFRAGQDWAENEVTWERSRTGQPWANPGGDFDETASAIFEIKPPTFGEIASGVWVVDYDGEDVDQNVAQWVADPSQNHGWLMKVVSKEKETQFCDFDTREVAAIADMFRPELVVYYSAPQP